MNDYEEWAKAFFDEKERRDTLKIRKAVKQHVAFIKAVLLISAILGTLQLIFLILGHHF